MRVTHKGGFFVGSNQIYHFIIAKNFFRCNCSALFPGVVAQPPQCGEDGFEGVRYQNVFGTYSHGPVLPKNPAFCDHLLTTALHGRYPELELQPLDDAAECAAHDTMVQRLTEK